MGCCEGGLGKLLTRIAALEDKLSDLQNSVVKLPGIKAEAVEDSEAESCIVECGLGELLSRVGAIETRLSGVQAQVATQVVQAVVSQLPAFITPLVQKCLDSSLPVALKSLQQTVVDSAVIQIKAAPSPGASPFSRAPNQLRVDEGGLLAGAPLVHKKGTMVGGKDETLEVSSMVGMPVCPVNGGGGELVEDPVQWDGLQAGKLRMGSTLTEASGAVDNPKASGVDVSREVEADLETGMLVGIHGLQSAPALNGTVGVIHGFDGAAQRYMVETESGTMKKFKRCNLVLEQEIDCEDEDECDESADGADSDDRLSGSGSGCHEKLNNGRLTASSLSAATACL